ncbi:uncharacterized protein [Miscanthus floridulus]|uniref:uncharacterized protein isoform X1 n=1 Tax=Miscanthus floridulus TaxID=154761 RepID=UPI0034580574
MPGWIIEGFELATNPTKLWRALRKPKEAKNVSPAGVRKEGSERNEAHRRPYCRKRGRSGVIVLLLVLLALAVTAAEGSQDDHVEMPPPPGVQCSNRDNNCRNRIFVAFIAKRRREEAKEMDEEADELQERVKVLRQTLQGCAKQDQDNNCRNRIFVAFIDDTIKYLETLIRRGREAAKRRREEAKEMDEVADELQERVKVLRQTLQGCAKQDQPEEGESPGEAQGPDTTQKLKLKFNGSLSNTIYTKDSLLQYSNGGPIEIAICRGDQIITSGDLSSLEVEIVVLEHGHTCKGDWTEEDFDHQIIRSGKKVSMLDEAIVQLDRGKASLGNIHFKEGSGGNSFILAARVFRSRNIIGTTRIEEAFMDAHPFHVLTERSKGRWPYASLFLFYIVGVCAVWY